MVGHYSRRNFYADARPGRACPGGDRAL